MNSNSIDPTIQKSPETISSDLTLESRWIEILASLACWIGIIGLIILIAQGARADTSQAKHGFTTGNKGFKPALANSTHRSPSAHPDKQQKLPTHLFNENDLDDDDDDLDLEDDFPPHPLQHPKRFQNGSQHENNSPHSFHGASPKTFSAGGGTFNAPDPVKTEKGIYLGNSTAGNAIINNKIAPIKIDDETAEGNTQDTVTDFNFPDADILDIAKTLGKLTGKNFVLDKDVKGRITIITNSPISVGEAWKVFLTALDVNGFAMIPSGKYLRIAKQRDARDKQIRTYTGDKSPDTDALITRVFQLKYISAEEVARTFRSFIPANARIVPYEQTNTVIVTDTGSNISKLGKMLDILDVEGYDAGIEVIPVKFASAAELSKLIDTLIPGTATGSPGGAQGGAPRFGGGSRFSARRTKEGGIINTIIADERTNTLIVHANTRGAQQVRGLVSKLDQKLPTSTGGGKVHVVYLQFADAEQIANTLNNFSSQAPGAGAKPAGGPGATGGTGINPNSAALFEGSIKISPDKATNSLVITASPSDYVTVQRVINRLDIPREQVYVEVVIMEVQISRSNSYSANIVSPASLLGSITNPSDITGLLTGAGLGSKGAIIGFPAGAPTTVNIGGQPFVVSSVLGLIKAIQSTTNSNVLATPQILALDNTEANFESAEKIPVPSTTSQLGTALQSFQYQPVAVSIKIKPQINKITNFVKLDVTAKLGDISPRELPKNVSDNAFATLDRTTQTTVFIGDSDTVVLGGLIRDKVTDVVNKIPLLGDIPLLGWLFKSKSVEVAKSNLLLFITPHIIRQYDKVRAILDKKLQERDNFLEASSGGEDPLRYVRDNMIRSLPNIQELSSKKPKTSFTIDDEKPAALPVSPPVSPTDATNSSPDGALPPGIIPVAPVDPGISQNTEGSAPVGGPGYPNYNAPAATF